MGTISDKLTYLNTTKGKIKDSINLTGAGITNSDTFRSYEKKLKDGLVDIINNGTDTLYNNFPKVTGTGSSATLNSTYQAPMKVGLKGNTYQGSNPTPSSPQDIEVVTGYNEIIIEDKNGTQSQSYEINLGKNLFDKTNVTSGSYVAIDGTIGTNTDTFYSDYIPVKPSTNYAISGKNNKWNNTALYDSSKTFISRVEDGNYVTTTSNTYYIRTNGKLENIDNIQIELGTQATTYSAYKTPIEFCGIPDTEYNDEIRCSTGKNLFDKEDFPVIQGTVPDVNGAELTEAVKNRTTYIPCKPNTTYTIQKRNDGNTNRFCVAYTKTLPVLNVLCYGGIRNNDATSISITTGNDAQYLVVFFYRTDETTLTYQQVIDSIQIEENNQATDYEPYGVGVWYKYGKIAKIVSYNGETITTDYISTTGQLTTGATVYYVLNTPTATILDTELQTQLNNLKGANSYSEQTNITAEYITGNQPFIMNLVALKDE